MKALVSLIGGQHVPNLLVIQEVRPDRLILLVTKGMQKGKDQLLQALLVGGLDYQSRCETVPIDDENSVHEVVEKLDAAYQTRPDGEEWVVNLTGGRKPMSIGAYTFSTTHNVQTLYIAEQRQGEAIELRGGPSLPIQYAISTMEFLAGYGFEVRNAHVLERNTTQARSLLELASHLTASHENGSLKGFLGRLQILKEKKIREAKREYERNGITLSPRDEVSLKNVAMRDSLCRQYDLKLQGPFLTGNLNRQAVEFLTGKWLEVFIWGVLSPFEGTAIGDLNIGVVVGGTGQGQDNELDVSYIKDQSLCIVECKTGGQRHDPNADNTLYKIEAVKAGLGAIRVETYFGTTSSNIIDEKTGVLKESLKNRASLYNCAIISGHELREMAELWIKKDTDALTRNVRSAFKLP